jgi:hypothetical protein
MSLTLETGSFKAALNLTKESHGLLWDSVQTASYKLFQQVDCCDFAKKKHDSISLVPVRLYSNGKPPIQPACRHREGRLTLGQLLAAWLPEHFETTFTMAVADMKSGDTGGDKEAKDSKGDDDMIDEKKIKDNNEHESGSAALYRAKDDVLCWRVSGIQPPFDTTILDLWKHFCHPDHFLYIVVLTK